MIGQTPISNLMSRLLTGHAATFNWPKTETAICFRTQFKVNFADRQATVGGEGNIRMLLCGQYVRNACTKVAKLLNLTQSAASKAVQRFVNLALGKDLDHLGKTRILLLHSRILCGRTLVPKAPNLRIPQSTSRLYQHIPKIGEGVVHYVAFSPLYKLNLDRNILIILADTTRAEIILGH